MRTLINFLKRLNIYITKNGHVYHFGDGVDCILIKSFPERWIDETTFTYDKKPVMYGDYLTSIGIMGVRVVAGDVFRFKCQTPSINMMWTRQLYKRESK